MSIYTPDAWEIVRIDHEGTTIYKVIAGWTGSYLYGASWKLNSGITKVSRDGDFYLVEGYSGSTYRLHKDGQRMIPIMLGILKRLEDSEADISLVDIAELEKSLCSV